MKLRFSLRTFLLAAVAISLVSGLWVRAHLAFQRSILRNGTISGFAEYNGSHDNFGMTYWLDHRNRPVAILCFPFDPFDPNVPRIEQRYRYTNRGGELFLNGRRLHPSDQVSFFTNGAFGQTVQCAVDMEQAQRLLALAHARNAEEFRSMWRELIESQLYQTEGTLVGKQRDARWTFRDANGAKYMEGSYKLDQRDGDWTTFYPNGAPHVKKEFDNGKPVGRWDYFDPQGGSLGFIDFEGPAVKSHER